MRRDGFGPPPMGLPRLAVICDLAEENWPSMDLVAEMLLAHLRADHATAFAATPLRPPLRRRFSRGPLGASRAAFNADRLLNRFWDYPRYLGRLSPAFDLFHLCDHSYAQLVHGLPGDRTGVFCHDVDTFRCLLEPEREPKPRWFKAMAWRILHGLQKAAVVFHTTTAVRRQLESHGLVDPARLVHAPNGIAPEFRAESLELVALPQPVAALASAPFVLHVGSCIPRKRIDVLLQVFAAVRACRPELALVQVGGSWTPAHRDLIDRLCIQSVVVQLCNVERQAIAALYRRAALVLQPSESEGFGLPVIEALACGAVVLASDIPVLREVGGDAVVYCPVSDVSAWAETVCRLLANPQAAPARATRLAQAQRYSWATYARVIVEAYQRLLHGAGPKGDAGVP